MYRMAQRLLVRPVLTAIMKHSYIRKAALSAQTAVIHVADRNRNTTQEQMTILLNSIRIYAYHGVLPQEQVVGDWYTINLRLIVTDETATETDNISDTINYAKVFNVVKTEMSLKSKLIEHVCGRIITRLFHQFPSIDTISISIVKQNPPINGANTGGCGIELTKRNPKL